MVIFIINYYFFLIKYLLLEIFFFFNRLCNIHTIHLKINFDRFFFGCLKFIFATKSKTQFTDSTFYLLFTDANIW